MKKHWSTLLPVLLILLFLTTAIEAPTSFKAAGDTTVLDPSPLVQGISSIYTIGVPGPLSGLSELAIPIVAGDQDTTPATSVVAMASSLANGRVVALGHDNFLVNEALSLFDNERFGNNVIDWLDILGRRKILVTTGHQEWYGAGNFDNFKSDLENRGYSVARFSGTIASSALSGIGVVLVGNAWGAVSQSEIACLNTFVADGGGLLLMGLGWSWEPYNPGKTLDDYPMNKIGEIFGIHWINGGISDPTNNYGGLPIFHTFYPNIEVQTIYQAFSYIRITTDAHLTDLPTVLQNDAFARGKFVNAHLFLAKESMELPKESPQRQEIYDFYKNLTKSYPQYFQKSIIYNKASQSTMAWLRERVYRTFISGPIYGETLTQERKSEIASAIGLSGRYLDIWSKFAVLLLDNTGLNGKQKDFIYDLLNLIPEELHNLHSISVIDNLGTLPSPTPEITLWGKNDGVNIFNFDIGAIPENGFPPDVSPKFSDVFSLVVVHEINHVVDAYSIWQSSAFQTRKTDLVRAAGNTSLNYLRSMFDNDFFTKAPQEFFASISNQWFSDTFHTLQLGLTRFSNGYKEPLNQFLFFADVYSLGLDQTLFYTLDTDGNIAVDQVALTRDLSNHVNSLEYYGTRYVFTLDSKGNVLNVNLLPSNLSVVAEFVYTPDKPTATEQVTFDASASYSSKGNVVSYEWDFGDGNKTTVSQPSTTHAYTNAGNYTVTLGVTDNQGLWNTTSAVVKVTAIPSNHDVALTSINPYRTIVSNKTMTSINVTAQNQGNVQEAFTVVLSYDLIAFGSQMITVSNGSSIILSFSWNTTGVALGNYTITATATPVLGEADTADNSQASTIQVSILGDLNGDGRVDMKDVSKVAAVFQVPSTSPKWASNGDLDENKVIDMKDISTIAKHFGEHI